jgi:hypothetical protein
MPLVEAVVRHEEPNLFRFLLHGLAAVCGHLGISTRMVPASTIPIDHSLRAQDKVIALAQAVGAHTYVNAIGGTELYDADAFGNAGMRLRFLRSLPFEYPQFGMPFVPSLSIIDVLMFNSPAAIAGRLAPGGYDLVTND